MTFIKKAASVAVATAIVAGLMGANALIGEPLSREKLLELAIDIEGHPDDANVKRALEELDYFTHEHAILGVYPASPDRY